MNQFSPSYDNKIARKYSVKTLEHKIDNKIALQEELKWPTEKKMPVLCIPTGMSKELGGDLLKEILPGLMTLGMEILILGKGSSEYGELFTKLTKEKGHRVAIVEDTEEEQRKMYAASDMALFLSDATKLDELQYCLNYGVVPVAPTSKAIKNYNPIQESGNAFMYDEISVWHCFAAVVRALETQCFPYDWRSIQRNCMEDAKVH